MDYNFKRYDNMDVAALHIEADEICVAIQNEKIFMFGCKTKEEEVMHMKNTESLRAELRYVLNKIKALEA